MAATTLEPTEESTRRGEWPRALKTGHRLDWGVRSAEEQIEILRRKIQILCQIIDDLLTTRDA